MKVEIKIEDLNSDIQHLRLLNSENPDQVFICINSNEVLININELRVALRKIAVKE